MKSIYRLIRKLGIRATYRGYEHLAYGLCLVLEDGTRLNAVTKRLYPEIAHHFGVSTASVERDLRTVVYVCWEYSDRRCLQIIAETELFEKPTTSDFLDILAGYLRENGES